MTRQPSCTSASRIERRVTPYSLISAGPALASVRSPASANSIPGKTSLLAAVGSPEEDPPSSRLGSSETGRHDGAAGRASLAPSPRDMSRGRAPADKPPRRRRRVGT